MSTNTSIPMGGTPFSWVRDLRIGRDYRTAMIAAVAVAVALTFAAAPTAGPAQLSLDAAPQNLLMDVEPPLPPCQLPPNPDVDAPEICGDATTSHGSTARSTARSTADPLTGLFNLDGMAKLFNMGGMASLFNMGGMAKLFNKSQMTKPIQQGPKRRSMQKSQMTKPIDKNGMG